MPVLASLAAALLATTSPDAKAIAVIDTAIVRMGGLAALENITRLKLEVVTEWQRHVLDDRLATPVSSYERDTELRDYSIPAWRYTRRFIGPGPTQEIIDVVTDSAAMIFAQNAWRPLSAAYIEERNELFTASPDRILVLARRAPDARLLADTVIAGLAFVRVAATVNAIPVTLHFSRSTGMLAMTRMTAGQPRDFGLAPWGTMDVQFRYSRWSRNPQNGLTFPLQTDVYRVGKPYKRMSWLTVQVNPAIEADSFAISDSMRTQFFATQNRAMYDLPMDSARVVDGTFATFGASGTPIGAAKIGGQWVVFEGGSAPLSAERSLDFLKKTDPAPVAMMLATIQAGASGGVSAFAKRGIPIHVASGARPYVQASMRGWGGNVSLLRTAADGKWIRVGSDSLRIESIDLPDAPRSAMVYVPSLRWLYLSTGSQLLQRDLLVAHARKLGWTFDRIAGPGLTIVGQPAPR